LGGISHIRLSFSEFIARRLLRAGRKQRVTNTAVGIATIGISLGICIMIVALAIVTGFQREIRGKVIGFASHIQISKYDSNNSLEVSPIDADAALLKEITAVDGVESAYRFARKPGIVKSEELVEGVLFKGVDAENALSFFKKHLVAGRMPLFSDTSGSKEILISKSLAAKFQLAPDSNLIVYFVQDPPKARKFKIAGVYETGLGDQDFDQVYVIGDLRVVQKLNKWESNRIGGIEITVAEGFDYHAVNEKVYKQIPSDLTSEDIEELYPQLFGWLSLIDTNVVIVIVLMLVVSVINTVTSLLILILERIQMIGILKALGASNSQISGIFLIQAAAMTSKGLLLGNILALSLCFIQSEFNLITLNEATYYLKYVPIHLDFIRILLLNVGFFIVSMSCLIFPSLLVSKFKPASTMRFT
jgi:lipoprotein-releasing system permease protein